MEQASYKEAKEIIFIAEQRGFLLRVPLLMRHTFKTF